MNKRIFPVIVIALALSAGSFAPPAGNTIRIRKVVIDAGHGGKDPGCTGIRTKITEKEVALAIALKLGALIEKNMKEVEVNYTRNADNFIELDKRAAIANDKKADLFICIHCNSGIKSVIGTETYVMGLHKTAENLEVAKRENSSILMEENYQGRYEGFDPNAPEANIIFSMYQNTYLEQSLEFASKIQDQIEKSAGRRNRGVKQAGFLVLYKTAMPSILIETGFLTNPDEEKFLGSARGQEEIAQAIYKAFKEYKFELEGSAAQYQSNLNEAGNEHPAVRNDLDIVFKVQILTSSRQISINSSEFNGITGVQEYASGGWYKYTVGEEKNMDSAYSKLSEIREKGFKSAFVVAFNKERRIPLQEAIRLLNNP